ncbi:MAG TPA: 4Fe-4S dicluster domain-containing protein [Dehalococcoidia bacterium]|nr:4Fe-4S dicluster domain-containing protein [Dehalococcoidia bacterium]
MADEITITFDGKEVKTQPGKMVLEAAIDAGVYVPYLCYHPGMKSYGACRMCVVSVEGQRGFPAACTLPVADGMKVQTESTEVNDLRKSVMEMLIAEHPSGCLTCHRIDICGPTDVCLRHVSVNDRCVTCPKNERCELKDTVRYLGMELESPLKYKYRQIPLEVADPFYDRDYNLCIVCARCVRACEELRGDDAIAMTERSGQALVGTSFGTSLLESGCEFCGACIDVCPVGALVERDHKWDKPRTVERSICPLCPVGCQMNIEYDGDGVLIRAIPEINSPANHGQACFKGKFGLQFVNDKSRLHKPLVRRDGQLLEATWDEALEAVAARLAEYSGESFAFLTSPNSTNEELYLAQKFARTAMKSNNVDQTSNTQPDLIPGLEQSLGYAGATNPIWDLEQSGCIIVFNSNVTEEHNVVGVPIKRAARKSTKLVVIDSREVELTRYAHVWLRPAPGTEQLLLGGLLKSVVDQGFQKAEWLAENCESPATLLYALSALDLSDISRITQVDTSDIAEAARLYGEADASALVYALDNIEQSQARDCVLSLVNLALVTGNIGKIGAGIYPMRQGANEQGASDVGCVPDRLPGYRRVSNGEDRQALEALWDTSIPDVPGLGLTNIIESAAAGQIKSMFLIGDSPNFTNGKLGDGLSALDKLEFLVVCDSFMSPTAQRADVVLPRATFAEKDGTYTNLERRIQRLKPGRKLPEGGARPEWQVICDVAHKMGAPGFTQASPSETMDEIARVAPMYANVSYRNLANQGGLVFKTDLKSPQPTQMLYASREDLGLQWPVDNNGKGTGILFEDGFKLRRAEPITPAFVSAENASDIDFPLWFVPGRVLLQQERDINIVKGRANTIQRDELVELNPADAAAMSIEDGGKVMVEMNIGRLSGLAHINGAVPVGVVASTALFGQLAVNLQSSEEMEPASKVPGLDIRRARINKID